MQKATLPLKLFSLHSVHLKSGLNSVEKNTQAQLIVSIHSGTQHAEGDFISVLQSTQHALKSDVNSLEKNTLAQLTVTIHSGTHSMQKALYLSSSVSSTTRRVFLRTSVYTACT